MYLSCDQVQLFPYSLAEKWSMIISILNMNGYWKSDPGGVQLMCNFSLYIIKPLCLLESNLKYLAKALSLFTAQGQTMFFWWKNVPLLSNFLYFCTFNYLKYKAQVLIWWWCQIENIKVYVKKYLYLCSRPQLEMDFKLRSITAERMCNALKWPTSDGLQNAKLL